MSRAIFGAAWAPSASTRAPASCARRAISASGFSVPSTFETWATATSFGPRSSSARVRGEVEQAVVGDRRPSRSRPGALGEQLPGDDVRVVLHLREHDPVAGADVGVAPGVGDEVDRLGDVAGEDDLAPVGGADVVGDRRAGALIGGGRLGRERVRAAVDVGVVAALVAVDRLDRGQDPLRAGARVEVRDRLAADLALERRERGPDALDREGLGTVTLTPPPRPPRGSSHSPSPRARTRAPGRPP